MDTEPHTDQTTAETAQSQPAPKQKTNGQHRFHGVRAVPHHMEMAFEHASDDVWRALKRKPLLAVTCAGLAGLGIASVIGASELAVGIATAVATYQIIKKHEPPSKALEEAARFGL